jgi:hypothetical protein
MEPSVGEKDRDAWEKRNRGEGEGGMDFPKDLCVILENCRGLSVKHKFHINLKP